MFCTHCGVQLQDADRFCCRCGTRTATGYVEAPPRRLARDLTDKKIGGVCSGFAHYFDCDVTLIRVAWLAIAVSTGVGFIAYVVAWIAMPGEYQPQDRPAYAPQPGPSAT